jgi:hypothetical protein
LIAPSYPTTVIPDVAVVEAVKSDLGLKTVLTVIQQSKTEYVSAVPLTTEVQVLSGSVTKYTVVLDLKDHKDQAVYLYDSATKNTTTVSVTTISSNTSSYYVTETSTDGGAIVSSNSPAQIVDMYP